MIAILLATFNGSRFLREQLDSLFRQTCSDFIVYVRDDGSTDDTCAIVRQYVARHPKQIVLCEDDVRHRGPKESFAWLLGHAEADYYMFCDQDDVWLETKVARTLRRMREVEHLHPNKPVMIHTDLKVVDEQLRILHESFWKWKRFKVDVGKRFRFACLGNVFTGCTIMLNDASKRVCLPVSPHVEMHDHWIGIVTAKYGYVENLPEQTLLYRQHENNVAGAGAEYRWTHWLLWWAALPRWYREHRPLLDEVGYGSVLKYCWYKSLHVLTRLF